MFWSLCAGTLVVLSSPAAWTRLFQVHQDINTHVPLVCARFQGQDLSLERGEAYRGIKYVRLPEGGLIIDNLPKDCEPPKGSSRNYDIWRITNGKDYDIAIPFMMEGQQFYYLPLRD